MSLSLKERQALAEKFRKVADSKSDVAKLADDTVKAHPGDTVVGDLCSRFKAAKDGDAVRDIADEVKAAKS